MHTARTKFCMLLFDANNFTRIPQGYAICTGVSNDCPTASEANMKNIGVYVMRSLMTTECDLGIDRTTTLRVN